MKKLLAFLVFVALVVVLLIIPRESLSADGGGRYGSLLCHESGYTCFRVPSGETWESLFPDETQRGIIMRVNRMGVRLQPGMIIAVPENLDNMDLMDYSPFDKSIPATGQSHIIANPNYLAWAAYDENGNLVRWGPASMGRDFCPDIGRGCHTKTGEFKVYQKGSASCISSKFPVPNGGAPMPYCMYFNGGYALHGSDEVEGYNASHGCIRMLVEDANWLSHNFVVKGTPVTVLPYAHPAEEADEEEAG